MSFTIEASIWIDRTPNEVFDFVSNPENWARYMPGLLHAEQLGEGERSAGTRVHLKVAFLGAAFELVTTMTRFERGVALGSSNEDDAPMGTQMLMTFTEEKGGTRMSRVDTLQPRRFLSHLTTPLLKPVLSRNTRLEFNNVKEILESEDAG